MLLCKCRYMGKYSFIMIYSNIIYIWAHLYYLLQQSKIKAHQKTIVYFLTSIMNVYNTSASVAFKGYNIPVNIPIKGRTNPYIFIIKGYKRAFIDSSSFYIQFSKYNKNPLNI